MRRILHTASRGAMAVALSALIGGAAHAAATITIVNNDGPNEGFNDPTPVTALASNPGTTLGQQRLNVFQAAADHWEGVVDSTVEIRIDASIDPMTPCSPTSGVLGRAGTITAMRDFPNAPKSNTWYPVALANAIAGVDNDTTQSDISAQFNSAVDNNNACLANTNWHYGIGDAAPTGTISFYDTVLHEMAHGLGVQSFVDVVTTGTLLQGRSDAYSEHLHDHSANESWPTMTNAERLASAVDTGDLHWTGPRVNDCARHVLSAGRAGGHVRMFAPNPVQGGSSVSHFDTALTPDELMEPFATNSSDQRLTDRLLGDIGWDITSRRCQAILPHNPRLSLVAHPQPVSRFHLPIGSNTHIPRGSILHRFDISQLHNVVRSGFHGPFNSDVHNGFLSNPHNRVSSAIIRDPGGPIINPDPTIPFDPIDPRLPLDPGFPFGGGFQQGLTPLPGGPFPGGPIPGGPIPGGPIPGGPTPHLAIVSNGHLPVGSFHFPAGSRHFPVGSFHQPAGSFHFPQGSWHVPVGSGHFPVGSRHFPAGSQHFPAGSFHFPAGSAHFPQGSLHLPFGSVQHNPAISRFSQDPGGPVTNPQPFAIRNLPQPQPGPIQPHNQIVSFGHSPAISRPHFPPGSVVHGPVLSPPHNTVISDAHDGFTTNVHLPVPSFGHFLPLSPGHHPVISNGHNNRFSLVPHSVFNSGHGNRISIVPHNQIQSFGHMDLLSGRHGIVGSNLPGNPLDPVQPAPFTPNGAMEMGGAAEAPGAVAPVDEGLERIPGNRTGIAFPPMPEGRPFGTTNQ